MPIKITLDGKEVIPTEEQQACIEAAPGRDSLMIQSYAGCSKTSTLRMMAPQVRGEAVLALAFNKKITSELSRVMPQNFLVKSLNGLGHTALARKLNGVNITLDDKKLGKLVTQVAKDRHVELSSDQWGEIRQLVTKVMQAGITPGNIGTPLVQDTVDSWRAVADVELSLDDEGFEFIHDLAHEVLERSVELIGKGIISFDDQIYGSVTLGGAFTRYPRVYVDEAQDLSPLNHRMLELSLRPDGQLTAVGDPKQAIYAFRGAHSASMAQIRGLRGQWKDLPLSTTFRCPKAIVARQQHHAPGFTAWHTNAEGRYHRIAKESLEDQGWGHKDIEGLKPHPRAQVAILCRNNGPLIALAFKLLRQGIGVVMLGRDLGKSLISLSRKLFPEDGTPIDQVFGKIKEWQETEVSKLLAQDEPEKIATITDRAECLRAVADGADCRDAGQLRAMLERLFAREAGQVTLATIHRAKGLEWDLVLHLDPWRIPSKWARQAAKSGDHRQLEQEYNLLYVCETRTRHTLVSADLEDFNS